MSGLRRGGGRSLGLWLLRRENPMQVCGIWKDVRIDATAPSARSESRPRVLVVPRQGRPGVGTGPRQEGACSMSPCGGSGGGGLLILGSRQRSSRSRPCTLGLRWAGTSLGVGCTGGDNCASLWGVGGGAGLRGVVGRGWAGRGGRWVAVLQQRRGP